MGRKKLVCTEEEKKEMRRLANKKYYESGKGKTKVDEAKKRSKEKPDFKQKTHQYYINWKQKREIVQSFCI